MHTLPTASFANLHFVTSTLAVGGDISAGDDELAALQFAEICSLGITHIVDVRLEWSDLDAFAASAPHIGYLHHGMDDAGQAVPPQWFEEAVSWIEAAYAEHPDAVVLTHCHMGINRGPSAGFAVLLGLGWDPLDALDAIRAARPVAFVAYAEDALRWHHEHAGTGRVARRAERRRLHRWREQHELDLEATIRQVREA